MFITTYQDPDQFLLKVRPTLQKDEVTHGLLLGVAAGVKKSALYTSFYLATIEDEGRLLVAACMTPPHNIILASLEDESDAAFSLLIQDLQRANWPVPGVLGPARISERFAQMWEKLTGQSYRVGLFERLFDLDKVVPPVRAVGRLRVATADDLDLIKHWMFAFDQEAVHGEDQEVAWQRAEESVRGRNMYIWETLDKRIVSMAQKNRPLVNGISIGPVYTPPEERGYGYASNCVAALSQLLLDQGWKYCSLFTNLANPTANSIYQKIGYRPVCDFTVYVFAEH
ncbi:MAG: GNAT family N-acetyltransferase [Ktedonobacteraceae bacterium]|nr:GNAT family N-acetyltransferase [Ktedonobacteraceae bacterium]